MVEAAVGIKGNAVKSKWPGRHIMPDGLFCLGGVHVQDNEQTPVLIIGKAGEKYVPG